MWTLLLEVFWDVKNEEKIYFYCKFDFGFDGFNFLLKF